MPRHPTRAASRRRLSRFRPIADAIGRPARLACAGAVIGGCVVVPHTSVVYDQDCHIEAHHMELEAQQVVSLVGCRNEGCVAVLVASGAVAAASAVVSGTIVVTGNVVYWFEKQGRCVR